MESMATGAQTGFIKMQEEGPADAVDMLEEAVTGKCQEPHKALTNVEKLQLHRVNVEEKEQHGADAEREQQLQHGADAEREQQLQHGADAEREQQLQHGADAEREQQLQHGADAEREQQLQHGADAEREQQLQHGADAEREQQLQHGADAEREQQLQHGADAEREQQLQHGADAEREPQHDAEREPQHDAEREPQHDAEREPQHDAEREPQHDAEREPQHDAEREPQHDAEREPQPQHDAEREPQHDAEREQQPEHDAEREQQLEHGADAEREQQRSATAEHQQRGVDAQQDIADAGKKDPPLLRYRHAGTDLEIKSHPEKDTVYQSNSIRMNKMGHLSTCKNEIWKKYAKAVTVFLSIIVLTWYFLHGSNQTVDSTSTVLKIFQHEFQSLRTDFPGQNGHLWLRSQKMLQKHLNKSHPMEPATLILAAAQDGEHTLRCLSRRLARAYSVSLNSTYLVIDASTKGNHDTMTTKLHIDQALSSGFESTSRAAILHRLEELPSGSLLILYKYCDHENAAFKNVALVLTVLLEEPTLEVGLSLRELEEKVKDFLWERFTNPNSVSSHNEMDVDKLSGVWSRISHLVLPVLPVDPMKSSICPLEPE